MGFSRTDPSVLLSVATKLKALDVRLTDGDATQAQPRPWAEGNCH
jgi:hypothetical protein